MGFKLQEMEVEDARRTTLLFRFVDFRFVDFRFGVFRFGAICGKGRDFFRGGRTGRKKKCLGPNNKYEPKQCLCKFEVQSRTRRHWWSCHAVGPISNTAAATDE